MPNMPPRKTSYTDVVTCFFQKFSDAPKKVFEANTSEAKVEQERGQFEADIAVSTRNEDEVGGHKANEQENSPVVSTPGNH